MVRTWSAMTCEYPNVHVTASGRAAVDDRGRSDLQLVGAAGCHHVLPPGHFAFSGRRPRPLADAMPADRRGVVSTAALTGRSLGIEAPDDCCQFQHLDRAWSAGLVSDSTAALPPAIASGIPTHKASCRHRLSFDRGAHAVRIATWRSALPAHLAQPRRRVARFPFGPSSRTQREVHMRLHCLQLRQACALGCAGGISPRLDRARQRTRGRFTPWRPRRWAKGRGASMSAR